MALYREVLETELPWLDDIEQIKRPTRLRVVLTVTEVQSLLSWLNGTYRLMGRLLYGTGMRLMECVRLRVKDVDFERRAESKGSALTRDKLLLVSAKMSYVKGPLYS